MISRGLRSAATISSRRVCAVIAAAYQGENVRRDDWFAVLADSAEEAFGKLSVSRIDGVFDRQLLRAAGIDSVEIDSFLESFGDRDKWARGPLSNRVRLQPTDETSSPLR